MWHLLSGILTSKNHISQTQRQNMMYRALYLQYNLNGKHSCEDNVSIGQDLEGKAKRFAVKFGLLSTDNVQLNV